MYFVTSWDDGHLADMKLHNLLNRYNLKGTFFITKNYLNSGLDDASIKKISINHEIGAHTISHPNLEELNFDEQYKEIGNSKLWIERIINDSCDGFCYPSGKYNNESLLAVKELGFLYARTVEAGIFDINISDIYKIPTTLHVYPYPLRRGNNNSYVWSDLFCPVNNNKHLKY